MEQKYIEDKMHELEKIINYKFNDINLLCEAMNATKIKYENAGKNNETYVNEGLALVGDTILKFVLSDKIFNEETKIKGEITKSKEKLENNHNLYNVSKCLGVIYYLYNVSNEKIHFYGDKNVPEHETVCCGKHDASIEAIIAAIYYDSSFDNIKCWILYFLYPLLVKIWFLFFSKYLLIAYSMSCYNKEKEGK